MQQWTDLSVASKTGEAFSYGIPHGLCSSSGSTTATSRPSTTLTTTTKPSTSSVCATASAVAVTFNETVITSFGQTRKLSGSISQLEPWNTANAASLSAAYDTASNPVWTVTVSLPAGTAFQYKFINEASSGTVTWEADANHSYTLPATYATAVTVSNTWQS